MTDANEQAMQLRVLVSRVDSGTGWGLRGFVREGLIAFVQATIRSICPCAAPSFIRLKALRHLQTAPARCWRNPAGGLSPGSP